MKKRFLPFGMVFLVIVLMMINGNMMGQSCPSGMVSYWKMQEQTGPQYLDSYDGHDGFAPNNSPLPTLGISGSAQLFNESSSTYVSIPDHENFDWGSNSSFSIELWVKFSGSSSQNQVFIGRDETTNMMQWWIGATITGKISWYLGSSDGSNGLVTSSASFNNGSWHHVVAVRDGTISRNYLYVDGVLQNTGGTIVNITGNLSSSAPLTFGSLIFNGNPDYFFTGAIDELAVYSRALDLNNDIIPQYNNLRLYQIGYCDGDDPLIFSTPGVEAMVGQLYRYDLDASGNSVPTYTLIQGPEDMAINPVSGEITWTPTSLSQNGHVIVRATNDKGFVEQEFTIYLADSPSCRNNLVAYWDFNDASVPPFYDNMSNYQLNGTGPVSVQGLVDNGLLFDGTNDSLHMYDTFEPNRIFFDFDDMPNFSMEVWVKSSATPSATMVIIGRDQVGNNTQYWLGINPDGTAGFYLRDWEDPAEEGYLVGGANLLNGSWHQIVGSYNSASYVMRLFVDGTQVGSASKFFNNFGGNSHLNIGLLDIPGDKYWFNGVLDELAFYNAELTDSRVLDNYNNGMAGLGACVYNHAPSIVSSPDTEVDQGTAYNYQLVASEIDPSDVLNIAATTKPAWLSFAYTPGASTAVLSGTPQNSDVGDHSILLRVTDGSVAVDQSFTITVVNVNDDPVITSTPELEVDQETFYSYTVTATDLDGDDLVYSAPQKPASFSFNTNTHVLSGTPTNDDVGVVDITVSVFDGTITVDQQFQITVNNVNDAPVISSSPITEIFQEEDYSYTLVATDPDGDDVTYSAIQIPAWMTFDDVAHILTGTTNSFVGIVDIILRVSDSEFDVNQEFQLTVKNVNDLPVISTDPLLEVKVGDSYLYQMDVTDEDGDELTFIVESIPDWLTLIPATNSAILSGTPSMGDVGSHTVIVKVSDGIGEVVQAFSVKVLDPTGFDNRDALIDHVYPIPAKDLVYFNFSKVGDYMMVLYDINGKVLSEFLVDHTNQMIINISEFSDHFIIYRLSDGETYNVGKIIKE